MKIKKVKPDFISRHAKARTYFYRLGLLANGKEALKDFEDYQRVESALNPTASVSKITGASSHISLNNFICALEKQFITEIRSNIYIHKKEVCLYFEYSVIKKGTI